MAHTHGDTGNRTGAGALDLAALVNEEEGWASHRIFTDPDIYELEVERIFNRCWLFLAHDTEIPYPGDYVLRRMSDEHVIVVRGEDGVVRAFLNSCRHRGAAVCRADAGNAKRFSCPYHAWTYDTQGRLLGTSFDQFYNRADFATLGLLPVAQLDTHAGLIFATWDPQAPSLREYLGDYAWYLDIFFRRTPGGMEVLGPPQRWVVETNWKIPALNFGTDTQHAVRAHYGPLAIGEKYGGISTAALMKLCQYAPQVSCAHGHGCILIPFPAEMPDFCGFPAELALLYRQTLQPAQYEFLRRLFTAVGTIFPYTSWIQPVLATVPDKPPAVFVSLRTWQPLGPQRIELWSWYLAEREAPTEWKREALKTALQTFSMSGLFEEDDAEIWASITQATKGSIARHLPADFRAGFATAPLADFPGPGTAYAGLIPECEQFNLLRHWKRLMCRTA
jgi:phenylpropionate dioxygenase-like ring-hydroxylating dioxygenase large terminal subunit